MRPRRQIECEGVPYYRYLVRYVTSAGRRREKVLYAPGDPWIRDTVRRWVHYADVPIREHSNVRIRRYPHPSEVSL